ncbi:alpha/beta-hydrolase [Exidia glandulosa HHB12029]|uniref:Alpha/beta-hydrolase n=1 Tax=Exidia glandulosa HHB12029 TaxID=1314781 RepID=A0A165PM12_EXIGL|nr:alpha/beta-hydrolase [Exidia glandulosa HHB12029]
MASASTTRSVTPSPLLPSSTAPTTTADDEPRFIRVGRVTPVRLSSKQPMRVRSNVYSALMVGNAPKLSALTFSAIALVPIAYAQDGPTLTLTNGRWIGANNDDQELEMFRSIPYAEPPVGDLRFRKTVPATQQCTQCNATVLPKACIQSASNTNESEDCLYMNIYRPTGTDETSLLPILVWIHGGSWQAGSATEPSFNLLKHAKEDNRPFIHIGIQYRLNAFGLLASEGMDQQDLNAALNDQLEALRFVKKNALQIGGDPDKIIVGGQSAGASGASLQWLFSSPEEQLFRGVILDSGGPLQYPQNAPADYDNPDGPTTQLISLANCTSGTLQDSIACLRAMPIEQLRVHTNEVVSRSAAQPHYTAWPPSLDGLFITERCSTFMAAGKFNKVPVLSGRNRDEGTVFTPSSVASEADIRTLVTCVLIPEVLDDAVFQGLLDAYPNDPALGSPFGTGNNPEWKRGDDCSSTCGRQVYITLPQTFNSKPPSSKPSIPVSVIRERSLDPRVDGTLFGAHDWTLRSEHHVRYINRPLFVLHSVPPVRRSASYRSLSAYVCVAVGVRFDRSASTPSP